MRSLVVLTALVASLPAAAFTGDKVDHLGSEPNRVRTFDPVTQGALHKTEAWQSFAATDGVGWQARFDELTGTPVRMWGPGLDMDLSLIHI